jgi:hypothetical protein
VLAGESRVKAQAAELDSLKAASREAEQQLAAAQAQVGVTPERSRSQQKQLAERAAEAQAAADLHGGRAQRLAAVLAFEVRGPGGVFLAAPASAAGAAAAGAAGVSCSCSSAVDCSCSSRHSSQLAFCNNTACLTHLWRCLARPVQASERRELQQFAALEHQLLSEQEAGLAAEAAQWRADAGAAAAQLGEARQRLVNADAALLQRDDEVLPGCGLQRTLRQPRDAAMKRLLFNGWCATCSLQHA